MYKKNLNDFDDSDEDIQKVLAQVDQSEKRSRERKRAEQKKLSLKSMKSEEGDNN